MIDRVAFVREMTLLCERFDRALTEPVMARYYETLSAALSTEQFVCAARRAFDEAIWFPSPSQLIDYALGSVEDAAELEWLELMRATQQARRAQLTDAGRDALTAIGGSWALQTEAHDRLRRAWREAYIASAVARRRQLLGRALPAGGE